MLIPGPHYKQTQMNSNKIHYWTEISQNVVTGSSVNPKNIESVNVIAAFIPCYNVYTFNQDQRQV